MTERTLALTGASGFVGSAIMRRLISDGWRVQALYRSETPPAGKFPDPAAARWIRGSLADPDSLNRLMQSAEAVVHCAGAVRGASADSFNRVNSEGVARLVQASRKLHPRPRFLLISSLAAREPRLSDYAASKRKGEDALRLGAGGMPWCALRPPAVYGPGDREMRPLLEWMQRRGVAPLIGEKSARFSMIYVQDLADAVSRALGTPQWVPGPFELDDGHPRGYSWPEVLAVAARVFNRRIRGVRVPRQLLGAVAGTNLFMARLFGYAPMLTPGKVRELTHPDWVCDNTAFSRATGWQPRTALAEGLAETVLSSEFGIRKAE
jgi:nucleoside-diphosphate-sugar epimerase